MVLVKWYFLFFEFYFSVLKILKSLFLFFAQSVHFFYIVIILQLNLIVYGETAFAHVIDSSNRCPMVLREMFSDLREIAATFFPGRDDVQRLVLSSFIMMRFFAAAIMNPKSFGLKRDQPVKSFKYAAF